MLAQPDWTPPRRRFLAAPRPAEGSSSRRIWEVDGEALSIVVGVLLDRGDLETLFRDLDGDERTHHRDDVLLKDAVSRCSRRGLFAQAVERTLDRRTRAVRAQLGGCPLAELARIWLSTREEVGGRTLAALLWALARDRRRVLHGLFGIVRGEIWVRALRLLGETPRRPAVQEMEA